MKRIDYLEFVSLMESFGITDRRFMAPLHQQLIEADGFGGDGVEFAAAVIQGSKPRDYFEVICAKSANAKERRIRKSLWPRPLSSRELLRPAGRVCE